MARSGCAVCRTRLLDSELRLQAPVRLAYMPGWFPHGKYHGRWTVPRPAADRVEQEGSMGSEAAWRRLPFYASFLF